MSRDLSTDMLAAVEASTVMPVLLWYGDFASGAVRVCTHTQDISYGGNTFTGLGNVIGMEEIRETGQVEATGAVFHLQNVPAAVLDKAIEAGYRRRRCSLYVGMLDLTTRALIADPVEFRYLMDVMTITEGADTFSIKLKVESRLVDLQRPRELRQTNECQQSIFPGDRFFEFVPRLQNVELVVGGGGATQPPVGAPVGGSGGGDIGGSGGEEILR